MRDSNQVGKREREFHRRSAITAEYQLIGSIYRQAWISACDRKPLVESPLEAGAAVAFEIYAVCPEPVTRAQ